MPETPDSRPAEIRREELIAFARTWGERVTPHQLVRWHKAELLPRPRRAHLGRGKGTVSLYPASAATLAVALSRGLRTERSLEAAAWFAWLEGHPVTPYIRRALLAELDQRISALRQALKDFEDEEPGNLIEDALNRPTPQQVGRVARDYRPTLLKSVFEIQLGLFKRDQLEADELPRAFPAFSRQMQDRPKWLRSSRTEGEMLAAFSRDSNLPRVRELITRLPDVELEQARDLAQRIWKGLTEHVTHMSEPMPRELFYSTLGAYFANGELQQAVDKMLAAYVEAGIHSPADLMARLQALIERHA